MHMIKAIPAFIVVALCAACGAAPDVGPTEEENTRAEAMAAEESSLTATPVPPIQLKKCIAGPFTTSGFGNRCPDYSAVASGLCSLNPEFYGGAPLAHSCQPIPGSIPQQYSYTLSYQCYRPQPCRY